LAPALAAHRGDEARALHRAAGDWKLVAAFQPQVGKVAQGLVVVVADVRGGDFVGGDVVAELGCGLPVDILPVELSAHQRRVLRQKQDPPPEHHLIRQLLDATGAQRSEHRPKDYPLPSPEQADFLGGVLLLLFTLQGIPSVALTATFHSPRVRESSGIAVSRAHRGVLWTHNDSADDAYVYATDLAGTDRGVVRIRGARAVDWEDIDLGSCPT